MSSERREKEEGKRKTAITVDSLGKQYRIYGRPHERFLEPVYRRLGSDRQFGLVVNAVDDVSFEVEAGATMAIIGRNGSGKSTLLEMITGTMSPTHGSARVHGRISALLELGAGFNPDFTGRQNYRLNASILGLSDHEIEEAEESVEEFADIGRFIDEPVRTYSSGMYVRLAFATAVYNKPDVLIVDEALAVGDVFFQQKCFDYLERELGDVTKLVVTHDLAIAARLADRCIVMDQGKLVFDGDILGGIQTFTSLSIGERQASSEKQDSAVGDADSESTAAEVADAPSVEAPQIEVHGDASSPHLFRISSLTAQQVDPETGVESPLGEQPWMCFPEHEIRLSLTAEIGTEIEHPVIGYLVRDRVGNIVFGENSVSSEVAVGPLSPGSISIEFGFQWPEVAEGDYTLTVGVGDGLHALFHEIVGWVQGVASMTSVPSRPVHGMINNELLFMEVERT